MKEMRLLLAALFLLFPGISSALEYPSWESYTNSNSITSIAAGPGAVWFGTSGGLLKFDLSSERFSPGIITASDGLVNNSITAVCPDGYSLWVATKKGVSFYDPALDLFRTYFQGESFSSAGADENNIYFDAGGYFRVVDKKTGSVRRESLSRIAGMLPDANTDTFTWYGRRASLSALRNTSQFMQLDDNQEYYSITAAAEDDRRIWIGTDNAGIKIYDKFTHGITDAFAGPRETDITGITGNSRFIWVTGGRYLSILDRTAGSWTGRRFNSSLNTVEKVDSTLWLGTSSGIIITGLDGEELMTVDVTDGLVSRTVTDIKNDGQDIWVGTTAGISRYSKAAMAWESFTVSARNNIADDRIVSIHPGRGSVWFATAAFGVLEYKRETRTWKTWTLKDGLSDNRAKCVLDLGDTLWIGTAKRGICSLSFASGKWKEYNEMFELPAAAVNDMMEGETYIWAATSDGAARYDRSTGFFRKFTVSDGLLPGSVKKMFPDGDYIWFATKQGLSRYYWNNPHRRDY